MFALSSIFCLVLTLALYWLVKRVHQKLNYGWSAPIFLVPVLLVSFLLVSGIPFEHYWQDTHYLTWLLGPATIAFAIPIYRQRELIKANWVTLLVGVVTGIVAGVGSSVLLAHAFALPDTVVRSLAPRSVSTPFALASAAAMGADPQLVAIFVVITGVVGMSLGEFLLLLVRVRSPLARGALFGASAHGAGTAKASEIGKEEGAVASLTMMLCGVVMVLLAPLIGAML
ncbi:LrgB family protein [Craterilacuibacter sp.]|uniref:LrgB family protein n=1 Tax=Craterilacuibacter sp. TaxID=2870909 RepID=UPI003F2F6359